MVSITDIFSWVWLVRMKQLRWKDVHFIFSLGRGDWRECLVKVLIKIGREKRTTLPLLFVPPPSSPSTNFVYGHSCGCFSGKAHGPSLLPTHSDLALKPFLCWLEQFLRDSEQGSLASIPIWEGKLATLLGEIQQLRGKRQVWSHDDYHILEVTQESPHPFPQGRNIIAFLL